MNSSNTIDAPQTQCLLGIDMYRQTPYHLTDLTNQINDTRCHRKRRLITHLIAPPYSPFLHLGDFIFSAE